MHIICVLIKSRGPYSGQKQFIKTVVVASCGYRLQAAATEANAKITVTSPEQFHNLSHQVNCTVH